MCSSLIEWKSWAPHISLGRPAPTSAMIAAPLILRWYFLQFFLHFFLFCSFYFYLFGVYLYFFSLAFFVCVSLVAIVGVRAEWWYARTRNERSDLVEISCRLHLYVWKCVYVVCAHQCEHLTQWNIRTKIDFPTICQLLYIIAILSFILLIFVLFFFYFSISFGALPSWSIYECLLKDSIFFILFTHSMLIMDMWFDHTSSRWSTLVSHVCFLHNLLEALECTAPKEFSTSRSWIVIASSEAWKYSLWESLEGGSINLISLSHIRIEAQLLSTIFTIPFRAQNSFFSDESSKNHSNCPSHTPHPIFNPRTFNHTVSVSVQKLHLKTTSYIIQSEEKCSPKSS